MAFLGESDPNFPWETITIGTTKRKDAHLSVQPGPHVHHARLMENCFISAVGTFRQRKASKIILQTKGAGTMILSRELTSSRLIDLSCRLT